MIVESQNVFKNPDGTLIARRINQNEILPTIQWLEALTGLDFTSDLDENGVPIKWLGTTGRKTSSGDLDLSVYEGDITKDRLKNILILWCKQQGIAEEDIVNAKNKRDGYVAMTGDSVHFRTPIMGDPEKGFVQTDFMFTADPIWQQFSMRGEVEGSQFKGMHRHILLASIARARGLKYSYKNALMDPVTDQTIEKNPDKIAVALLGSGSRARDIQSISNILNKIKTDPDYERLVASARETLSREGVMLPEGLQVGSARWFRNLMDGINNEELLLSYDRPKINDIANEHGIPVEYVKEQLKKGIAIEYERVKDRSAAIQIALSHLDKDPDFYVKVDVDKNKRPI